MGSLILTRSLLRFNGSLLAHGSEDDHVGILLLGGEKLSDLVANLTIRHFNIVLSLTIVGHEGEEAIVRDVKELVFLAGDVGDIHVVGGGAEIFKLLASENVKSDKMDLGVTVLSSLGSGHIDDLARAVLDNNEAVLPQGRALHGIGGRGTGVGRVESVLMLRIVRHVGSLGEEERSWC